MAGGGRIGPLPVPFLTQDSTNSVPVSPLKTDAPFLALNAQPGFLKFKAERKERKKDRLFSQLQHTWVL